MPLPSPTWPKAPYYWREGPTLMVSIPFTWNLPGVYAKLSQASFLWEDAIVGGPAVDLMPDYFMALPWVTVGHEMPGILQRVNPMATRTTTGCPNKCGFCAIGIGKVEPGGFRELEDWPDLPVICDNNLLAASLQHFDKVIDRLIKWGWADFNQGLDARLLTGHHAKRLAEIKKPTVRLALDHPGLMDAWGEAYDLLRGAGIAKSNIHSYAIIGFNSDPLEAWSRCQWIESHGIKAFPMWYHSLNQMKYNSVTPEQASLGWNKREYNRIMGYYYQHRGSPPCP